ncbi:MAG: peptidase U32 family protein [Syntrophomonadaceae bacterium]|jgi:putative protease
MKAPELVMPAGSLEKLETAVLFGADAVYLGGKEFSLRAFAGNFTLEEIHKGVIFAHQRNKKVYITVNIFAHNRDIDQLPAYLQKLAELQVDGLIISDPGVIRLAQTYAPGVPITVSTQANVTNYQSASFYRDLGATRIVLARELSLEEIAEIKNRVDVELEVFVHGAMCVSYSGRCLLSYYMTGRSANRGACAHPCRYSYSLMEEKRPGQYYPIEEDERGSYILNSHDLCLLEWIPDLIGLGVTAFKVEGRMKSPLYVASVAMVYQKALDVYQSGRTPLPGEFREWMDELNLTATRGFTTGFITGQPASQDLIKAPIAQKAEFCGIVTGYRKDWKMMEVEQRSNFGPGDQLELLIPGGEILKIELEHLYNDELEKIDRARHPRQKVFLPWEEEVPESSILRRVVNLNQQRNYCPGGGA